MPPQDMADTHDHRPASDPDTDDDMSTELKHELDSTSGSRPGSSSSKAAGPAAPVKPAGHMQKRRRVTRACDECRRKKIKCDGKQPCTHCTVYSYECTYDQPSNRRRNPAPQYVECLEHRVHRAESLLHILIPNLDLTDPGIDAAVAQGWIPGAPGRGNPTPPSMSSRPPPTSTLAPHGATATPQSPSQREAQDTKLESMVRAVGQLDMDEQGHWDYHGHSSGLSFMRRMREQLGDMLGPDQLSTPFVLTQPMIQVLDSPDSLPESPGTAHTSPTFSSDLPPIDTARQMCSHAIMDATALMRVVHLPSFWRSFDRVYQTAPEQYTNEDHKFIPLLHAVMALGHLFGKDESSTINVQGYANAIQRGFAHFETARTMMDIADCRDLTSIQAVVFMILFLQSSAKLSECYAYVGVALRSAVRMGLHRAFAGNFDPIEAETRKRVFWIVRKMDIYIGAMLGLPLTLNDEDIDQEFPIEVDDEYITKDGIRPMPPGEVSLITAFNAHTRLVQLLQRICRQVYPIKVKGENTLQDNGYSIPFSVIRDIESCLEEWKNSLPPILSPCAATSRYTRIQQMLRLSYAHTQVMLYRPFLHYVAMKKRSQQTDQRAYACAASYVNVSRNIIHIVSHMKQKGLLNGAYWFIMYTAFFSILSLVYFAAENQDNPTTQAVMHDAIEGRQVLASLSKRSMAADRCTVTLDGIFQRLPSWMQLGEKNPIMSRKRHYNHDADAQASRNATDVSTTKQSSPTPGKQKRASTFPHSDPIFAASTSPSMVGSSWSQQANASSNAYPATLTPYSSDPQGQDTGLSNGTGAKVSIYSSQTGFASTALPDLSTIMFPTADEPFSYPNQPLTTFENAHFPREDDMSSQNFGGIMPSGTSSQDRGDELDAQYYALPPYFGQMQARHSQSQQQNPSQQPRPLAQNVAFAGMDMNNVAGLGSNGGMAQQLASSGWTGQPGPSIDSIFGGPEWNPMLMNPRYQNQ